MNQLLEKSPLYERLADEITRQIKVGTYRIGDRLPSVRQTSQQRGISITTVLQAYHVLEDRGMIEARPQSGYFVRARLASAAPEPATSEPPADPTHVSVEDLAMQLLVDSGNPNLVQFGAAIPHPDLLPTPKLNRILASIALHENVPHHLCSIPGGCEDLRIQAAKRSFLAGCNLGPDDIVVTSGCMEAVSLSLRAVCRPGDLVAIESPTYFGILQVLERLGLRALEIPTHYRTGMSLEALKFALDHHPVRACLIVSNFNNPLGSCMPDENKRELVEMLAESEIPLIEDDINGELYYGGQRPIVAKSYDREGLVLLCGSYSKDISPSYRVGWIAAGRFKNEIERLKINQGTAILTQLAIARFLENGGYDQHLRRIRRAYAQKVAAMSQAILKAFPDGTRVSDPGGGFVLWVQMPEKVDSLALYRRARKAGITLAPGYIFSPTAKYQNYIRLNAAYWSDDTEVAVQRIGEFAQNLAR